MKIGRLWIGRQECSDEKTYSLASWQYVTGYWRWCFHWRPTERIAWKLKFGPSFDSGRRYYVGHGRFGFWFALPWGTVSFSTQPAFSAMKRWKPKGGR